MGDRNAHDVVGVVHGRRFAVEVPAALSEHVAARLPAGWEPCATAERRWRVAFSPGCGWQVFRDGRALAPGERPEGALDRMLADVEVWVADGAVGRVLVRGSAVARQGRAVVLLGPTGSGRRTLARALAARCGHGMADRLVVLDASGRVLDTAGRAHPVALIAHLRYAPAPGWQVRRLTPGRATLAVIDAAVSAARRPADVAAAAQSAARGAPAVAGTRGEAGDAARRLVDGWLDRPGTTPSTIDLREPVGSGAGPAPRPASAPGRDPSRGAASTR